MLRVCLCEDDRAELALAAKLIRRYAQEHAGLRMELTVFEAPHALLEAMDRGAAFDIFLLDILMPGMDGIALAKKLRGGEKGCAIIFLTNSRDYALDAFSVRAVDYLLKPLDEARLFSALDAAVAALGSRVETHFLIPASKCERLVRVRDIVCVEVMGHSLCFYMADGERHISKVLRISFEKAAAELISDGRFLRPHRSFLINATHVEQFSKNGFGMDNGMNIPISRLRYGEIKDEYMTFLSGQKTGA